MSQSEREQQARALEGDTVRHSVQNIIPAHTVLQLRWVGAVWGSTQDPTVWGLPWIDLNHVSGFRQIGLKLQHF